MVGNEDVRTSEIDRLTSELESSRTRFEMIMEASGAGFWDWDFNGDRVFLSHQWKQMLGYTDDQLKNSLETWAHLVTDDDRRKTLDLVDECRQKKRDRFQVEFGMKHRDGHMVDILSYALVKYGDDGEPMGLTGIHLDLSEIRDRERELEDSRKRYRLLFENMVDGAALHEIITDENGHPVDYVIRDANSRFVENIGMNRNDLLDIPVTEIFPNTEQVWIEKFGQVALSGEPLRFTDYSRELDRYYETTVYSPQPRFFAAIFTDVTSQKQAEKALMEAKTAAEKHNRALKEINETLESSVAQRTASLEESLTELKQTQEMLVKSEKLAAIGSLVGGIAHEINTPLGVSITGISHLLDTLEALPGKTDDDETEHALEMIREAADLVQSNLNRVRLLINTFKQTAAENYDQEYRKFNLGEAARSAVELARQAPGCESLEVSVRCPTNLIIESHPTYINVILTNLLKNSSVHGYGGKGGFVEINFRQEQPDLHIYYRDYGIGISRDAAEKVFDPFFTTGRQTGSTGLGLNIIHNLIFKRMKGTIELDPDVSPGALFRIRLPGLVN